MLKHVISNKCNKKCDYCIARNIKEPQNSDLFALKKVYQDMYWQGHKAVMLTGGEPTIAPNFNAILFLAFQVFDEVYLTTNDADWVIKEKKLQRLIDGITLSLHNISADEEMWQNLLRKSLSKKVYASILDHQYFPGIEERLAIRHFDGLTICENNWSQNDFDESALTQLEEYEFSIRINRREHCIKQEFIILPDLHVTSSFDDYMKKPGKFYDYQFKKV